MDWPLRRALRANRIQIDDVARADICTVDGVRRDPQRVRLPLRSLARNVCTAVGTSKLVADVGGRDNDWGRSKALGSPMSHNTTIIGHRVSHNVTNLRLC